MIGMLQVAVVAWAGLAPAAAAAQATTLADGLTVQLSTCDPGPAGPTPHAGRRLGTGCPPERPPDRSLIESAHARLRL